MGGNVKEWVSDWLGYYKDTTITNYVGAPDGVVFKVNVLSRVAVTATNLLQSSLIIVVMSIL